MIFKQSLMDNNSIKLQAKANDWMSAIKIGTDMLVASGAVEPRYYEAIINAVKKMGPYIIIAPNFAMPHARPEDGVKKTAFALVTLETPILFENEPEPVDVLITLAGSTSDEHLAGLMEVMSLLEDEQSETGVNLTPLRLCRTVTDVYQAIDNAIN